MYACVKLLMKSDLSLKRPIFINPIYPHLRRSKEDIALKTDEFLQGCFKKNKVPC